MANINDLKIEFLTNSGAARDMSVKRKILEAIRNPEQYVTEKHEAEKNAAQKSAEIYGKKYKELKSNTGFSALDETTIKRLSFNYALGMMHLEMKIIDEQYPQLLDLSDVDKTLRDVTIDATEEEEQLLRQEIHAEV